MSQLLQGDCLEVLPTLPDQSIDMILADLPYAKTASAWDKLIPMDALWREYKRLIKPRGAIVLTAAQPFTSMLIMSNLKWYRHCWVWDKGAGTGFNAKRAPIQQHEDVLVFSKNSPNYYPCMIPRLPGERTSFWRTTSSSVLYGVMNKKPKERITLVNRYPSSVIHIPKLGVLHSERIHPSQKPASLFEYIIKTYSLPGQTVLDNAAGSMTTAIAAIRTGREYICIERDAEYFAKGSARVERELATTRQTPLMPQDAA